MERRHSLQTRPGLLARFAVALCALTCASVWAADRPFKPKRLADGHPDLQGIWIASNLTPLQRPQYIDSLVISAEKAREFEAQVNANRENLNVPNPPSEYLDSRRIEPIRGERRSSLIIDPPDGKLPATPHLNQQLIALERGTATAADGPEQRSPPERCITSPAAQPPIMSLPAVNLHQVVQTSDAILLHAEAMHDARIVRMNAAHRPGAVATLLGDSIGHWDGDTLVIETTHFSPSADLHVAPRASFVLATDAKVTERLTRVSNDELQYEFTVEDPVHYTRPWHGESHFLRSQDRLFEYACHEGNYSLTHILEGARAREGSI